MQHLRSLAWLLGLQLLSLLQSARAYDNPGFSYSNFSSTRYVSSFNDSTSVLLLEGYGESTIAYVSQDSGKSWEAASVPHGVSDVMMHPFDSNTAYLLGLNGSHHRTNDRGRTWHKFEVPGDSGYGNDAFSFHSGNKDYVIYNTYGCEVLGDIHEYSKCHREAYYTRDGFATKPKTLLKNAQNCLFARSSVDFTLDVHENLIFCVEESRTLSNLVSSDNFFASGAKRIPLGDSKYSIWAVNIVGRYIIADGSDLAHSGQMSFVSQDGRQWTIGKELPTGQGNRHATGQRLLYEKHSFTSIMGDSTILASNENGTAPVEVLKDTDSNIFGSEMLPMEGVDTVIIANTAEHAPKTGRPSHIVTDSDYKHRSKISFDAGSTWVSMGVVADGALPCNASDTDSCAFHVPPSSTRLFRHYGPRYSIPQPGSMIKRGSVGPIRKPDNQTDLFLTVNGGATWRKIKDGQHRYAISNYGNSIVLINSTEAEEVLYSNDFGRSWKSFPLRYKIIPSYLISVPSLDSDEFILVGTVGSRWGMFGELKSSVVSLDFTSMRSRRCTTDDMEKWYLSGPTNSSCAMGEKRWYTRRKEDSACFIDDPSLVITGADETCECTREDYECDVGFVKDGSLCVPAPSDGVPGNACQAASGYTSPSGYRRIPGNKCRPETPALDAPVWRTCTQPKLDEGEVAYHQFSFSSEIVQRVYLGKTVLVLLLNGEVWQSLDEGYSWSEVDSAQRYTRIVLHPHSSKRAFLLTKSSLYLYTVDGGRHWYAMYAPGPPYDNTNGATLKFHPNLDFLIWKSGEDCAEGGNCKQVAHYSVDNGGKWGFVDSYVSSCAWRPKWEESAILCAAFAHKEGDQRTFNLYSQRLQLLFGTDFYRRKLVIAEDVAAYAAIQGRVEYAELNSSSRQYRYKVLASDHYGLTEATFPDRLYPYHRFADHMEGDHGVTIMFIADMITPELVRGSLLKSDLSHSSFALILKDVNTNKLGAAEYEGLASTEGVALANVITNFDEARITHRKKVQTRITHDGGSTWKKLVPPARDSDDRKYGCDTPDCALHVLGISSDKHASLLGTQSAPGLMLVNGVVGTELGSSETRSANAFTNPNVNVFLSRDAGFTWEEVRSGQHVWAIGDGGAIIVMARAGEGVGEATNQVVYTTDEGLTWHKHIFMNEGRVRVKAITVAPEGGSRKFMLYAHQPGDESAAIVVQLDYSALTSRECQFNEVDSEESDFEFWDPADDKEGRCLLGKQTLSLRRKRDRNCTIGEIPVSSNRLRICPCTNADFECETNYERNEAGECMLSPGAKPLAHNTTCSSEGTWYERTAYRKVSSVCEGGIRLDRGKMHACSPEDNFRVANEGSRGEQNGHGIMFWLVVSYLAFAIVALAGYGVKRAYRASSGRIRLPDDPAEATFKK